MIRCLLLWPVLFCLGFLAQIANAQKSEMFGPYELHYSVVNSTFLEPDIAATYGITRGKNSAFINLAVREHTDGKSDEQIGKKSGEQTDTQTLPRSMLLQGKTWDLIQNQSLEFQEIREGDAVYYIAEFKFINEEWRFFEIDFRPEDAEKTYTFKFKHQLHIH